MTVIFTARGSVADKIVQSRSSLHTSARQRENMRNKGMVGGVWSEILPSCTRVFRTRDRIRMLLRDAYLLVVNALLQTFILMPSPSDGIIHQSIGSVTALLSAGDIATSRPRANQKQTCHCVNVDLAIKISSSIGASSEAARTVIHQRKLATCECHLPLRLIARRSIRETLTRTVSTRATRFYAQSTSRADYVFHPSCLCRR